MLFIEMLFPEQLLRCVPIQKKISKLFQKSQKTLIEKIQSRKSHGTIKCRKYELALPSSNFSFLLFVVGFLGSFSCKTWKRVFVILCLLQSSSSSMVQVWPKKPKFHFLKLHLNFNKEKSWILFWGQNVQNQFSDD